MNKKIKTLAYSASAALIALAFLPFTACGDAKLIKGDFSKPATEEQLAEVRAYIAETDSESIFGDATEAGWSYDARFRMDGAFDLSANCVSLSETEGEANSGSAKISFEADSDHVVSMAFDGTERTVRGSGDVNFSLSEEISSNILGTSMVIPGSLKLEGSSYNDGDYFYLNGSAEINTAGIGISGGKKVKIPLGAAFEKIFNVAIAPSGEADIDLTPISEALDSEGSAAYVDDSSTFKLKVSLNAEAWVAEYAWEIGSAVSSAGIEVDTQQIADNIDFGHFDYYLEFDKDSGVLLGMSVDCDVSCSLDIEANGYETALDFNMDIVTGITKSAEAAEGLPDDLSEYREFSV